MAQKSKSVYGLKAFHPQHATVAVANKEKPTKPIIKASSTEYSLKVTAQRLPARKRKVSYTFSMLDVQCDWDWAPSGAPHRKRKVESPPNHRHGTRGAAEVLRIDREEANLRMLADVGT